MLKIVNVNEEADLYEARWVSWLVVLSQTRNLVCYENILGQ